MVEENEIANGERPQNDRFASQVRFPRFCPDQIEQWFWQLEASMEVAGLTNDRKKFMTVISLVDTRCLTNFGSIINNPPTDGTAFSTIKKALIARYVETANERMRRLVSELQLGDKKPSHLLEEMRNLGDGKVNDTVLIQFWIQRLPQDVQKILSAAPESTNLTELARMADRIHEIETQRSPIASVTTSQTENSCTSTHNSSKEPWLLAIEAITKRFDQLESEIRGKREVRSHSRSRSNNNTTNNQGENNGICWYHEKYGQNARTCRLPCSFRQTTQLNQPR